MSVSIHFAQRQNVYTNMDTISGKVVLYLRREDSFSAVNVKLEGEGRTRLAHPLGTRSGDRGETELEVHKLLYNIQTVFPTTPILGAKAYTLPAGQHEFPFAFRLPFNNACNENNIKRMQMGAFQVDMRDVTKHVKAPLPPTVAGFPGEAEIKYYVKVTAERPAFYKENYRSLIPFKFLPIEKPRPPPNTRETYGRRKHQFSPYSGTITSKTSNNPFRKPSQTVDTYTPPHVSIDARLPDPAIITCNKPLPLRVLITKLNESQGAIYLRTFQITLWGHTRIRSHALERIEASSWVLSSVANMQVELKPETGGTSPSTTTNAPTNASSSSSSTNPLSPTTPKEPSTDLYPMLISPSLWSKTPLPPSVAPTFETCNLSRWYELEVSVGLSWGTPGGSPHAMRPELTVQPIRLKVDVYSGIAPSPALISRFMTQRQRPAGAIPAGVVPVRIPAGSGSEQAPPVQPPRPGEMGLGGPVPVPVGVGAGAGAGVGADGLDPGASGPSSVQAQGEAAPAYDEPPPSYEDAMAEDLAPVDGFRQDYQVPESAPVRTGKRRDS